MPISRSNHRGAASAREQLDVPAALASAIPTKATQLLATEAAKTKSNYLILQLEELLQQPSYDLVKLEKLHRKVRLVVRTLGNEFEKPTRFRSFILTVQFANY